MLDATQVEDHYRSQSKYFIGRPGNTSINMLSLQTPYLLKDETDRLLAVAKNPMSVKAVSSLTCIPEYSFFISSKTNYNNNVDLNKAWHWCVNQGTKSWVVNLDFKSLEYLDKCILINQKVLLLDIIHHYIEIYRSDVTKRLEGQETVYLLKYLEAKEILEKNIETDPLLDYPFTSGYASTVNISLQESAKQIVFQHNDTVAFLAESENLRIRYTNLIRNETELQNLCNILEDFDTESTKYSYL